MVAFDKTSKFSSNSGIDFSNDYLILDRAYDSASSKAYLVQFLNAMMQVEGLDFRSKPV